MLNDNYEKELKAQSASDFKLSEFLDKKGGVPIKKERNQLQNIRNSTKPIYQKVRFLIIVFFINAFILSLGLGIGLTRGKNKKPFPTPQVITVSKALTNQFNEWNYATSQNCLAIQLNPEYNVFLKGTTRANTYMHSYNKESNHYDSSASIVNSNIYTGPLQLFNVRAISTFMPDNGEQNSANPGNRSLIRLVGGNRFGVAQYEVNLAGSLSFGSELPWDQQYNDVDAINLNSKQLEATMHFSYDANTKPDKNPISKITFASLADDRTKAKWLQNYNFKQQASSELKNIYLPLLKNGENTPGKAAETTSISNIYDNSYESFSYTPGVNKLDDSYFNQPTSMTNLTPLFHDILFQNNSASLINNVFGTKPKASGFIGVKTPYVFSSDFVKSVGVNKSLVGTSFFSNLMFNKLRLNALNATAIMKNGLTRDPKPVFGKYAKGLNPLYNESPDSWTLTGISSYYGLTDKNGLLFKNSKTDPIKITPHKGVTGSGNNATSRGDSTNINNLFSGSSLKTQSLDGAKMIYPGFAYNSLPFYNFGNYQGTKKSNTAPFVQYNLGLYHSADLGDAVNQMSTDNEYNNSNTSVANIVNGLGMANISFGDSSNPYYLPKNNSPEVNMFDQLLNFLAKTTTKGLANYRFDHGLVKTTAAYKSQGMPRLKSIISSEEEFKNQAQMFFSPYLEDDSGQNKTFINNYLMALLPRLILKSDIMFIPYSGTNSNRGTVSHFNTDAKKWALALIMPSNTNLIIHNPVVTDLFPNPNNTEPALQIHTFAKPLSDGGDLLSKISWLQNTDGSNYKLSFKVSNSDSLPQPTNWWASMDDRSIFDSKKNQIHADPTLSAMSNVGIASSRLQELGKTYPDLAMVYNGLDSGLQTTMSAHPGSFSWIPFNLFRS